MPSEPLRTPDGRYIIVEGRSGPRLWRASNPALPESIRSALVEFLMESRRLIHEARGNEELVAFARQCVHAAKCALGERGPVWWDDGSPDLNRRLVRNTPYADWYSTLSAEAPTET